MTRNGKIDRLPAAIRAELNQRLVDGEQGKQFVEWLNGLPRVQALLKDKFQGIPISEANLSHCRNDAVALGSAVVSTAVFGVSPKTSVPGETPPNGERAAGVWLASGTPTRATETVALPISNESFRHWKNGRFPAWEAGEWMADKVSSRDASKNPELTLPPAMRASPVKVNTSEFK